MKNDLYKKIFVGDDGVTHAAMYFVRRDGRDIDRTACGDEVTARKAKDGEVISCLRCIAETS